MNYNNKLVVSQSDSEIVSLVQSVSDQIALVALNAAIEADRAGEYGKGFADVALDIAKLADQSKQVVILIENLLLARSAEDF